MSRGPIEPQLRRREPLPELTRDETTQVLEFCRQLKAGMWKNVTFELHRGEGTLLISAHPHPLQYRCQQQ